MSEVLNPYRAPAATFSTDPLSVPYAGQARMQLVVSGGLANARVRVDPDAVSLIRVEPGGPAPQISADDETVRVVWATSFGDWARRMVHGVVRSAPEIVLHPAVAWSLEIHGGLSNTRIELAVGRVAAIELDGGCSKVDLELPAIARATPVRIAGGASQVQVRRPAGVGVSVAIGGGATSFRLDGQGFDAIGGDAVLRSGLPGYEIAVSGGASELAILEGDAGC